MKHIKVRRKYWDNRTTRTTHDSVFTTAYMRGYFVNQDDVVVAHNKIHNEVSRFTNAEVVSFTGTEPLTFGPIENLSWVVKVDNRFYRLSVTFFTKANAENNSFMTTYMGSNETGVSVERVVIKGFPCESDGFQHDDSFHLDIPGTINANDMEPEGSFAELVSGYMAYLLAKHETDAIADKEYRDYVSACILPHGVNDGHTDKFAEV